MDWECFLLSLEQRVRTDWFRLAEARRWPNNSKSDQSSWGAGLGCRTHTSADPKPAVSHLPVLQWPTGDGEQYLGPVPALAKAGWLWRVNPVVEGLLPAAFPIPLFAGEAFQSPLASELNRSYSFAIAQVRCCLRTQQTEQRRARSSIAPVEKRAFVSLRAGAKPDGPRRSLRRQRR